MILSNREKEILGFIADEYTNVEIAHKLHISVETVKSHRKNLFEKLGARNVAGLIRRAFEHRILTVKTQQVTLMDCHPMRYNIAIG